jgi:hypothetical protein
VKLLFSASNNFSIDARRSDDGYPNCYLFDDELCLRFSFDFLSLSVFIPFAYFAIFYIFSPDQLSSFELLIELPAPFLLGGFLIFSVTLPHLSSQKVCWHL